MRIVAVLLPILLLVSPAYSLFLVGQGKVGDSIPILCEQQEKVFVSSPDGSTQTLGLDMNFQADFTPQQDGPYTVQCGRSTKTVQMEPAAQYPAATEQPAPNAALILGASVILAALLLSAVLFAARIIFSQTIFEKSVQGNRAKLRLLTGKKLEKIEIEDPVSFSYSGKMMRFSIPSLSAGREWSWEYDISLPEKALPASLVALERGKKISLLSRLLIEGKEGGVPKASGTGAASPKLKRALPKAI